MEANTSQGNVFNIATHKEMWGHMNTIAKTFIESRAMPSYIQNSAQAMIVLQAGQEMGLQFMESIKYLYLINGQIALTGQGAARKLRDAGYRVVYEDAEDQCTVIVYENEKEVARETVTYEEAKQSGYTSYTDRQTGEETDKIAWRKGMNRKLKLRYLGLSTLIKTHLPEVLGSAMDIKEVAEDYPREVIDAETLDEKVDLTKDTPKSSLNEFLEQKKAKQDNNLLKGEEPQKEAVEGEIVDEKESSSQKTLGEVMQEEEMKKAETAAEKKAKTTGDNTELVEEVFETEGKEVPVDPKLAMKRKEFFATANDLGVDAEIAKAEVKKYYGDKKSFLDLNHVELSAYVRAMKVRLMQKRKEQANG